MPAVTEQELVDGGTVAKPHRQIDVTVLARHVPDPEVDRPSPEEPVVDTALPEQLRDAGDRVELRAGVRAHAVLAHGGRE